MYFKGKMAILIPRVEDPGTWDTSKPLETFKFSFRCILATRLTDPEKRNIAMFAIVTHYCAKSGEEDALIALHEDRQNRRDIKVSNYYSWELLKKTDEPQKFISIARFADEKVAQEAIQELEKDEWYGRLVNFMEESPLRVHYTLAWSLH